MLSDAQARLAALETEVRRSLSYLDYPKMSWVTPRAHPSGIHVYDVVIVGAGQGGLATAFGLRREKIENVICLDRAEAGREGPWITYARMLTLRSPKHVTGPDLGVAALTPQAWYVAVYGEAAWDALGKWPRWVWQDYLIWYRKVLELPVHNRTEVTKLAPDGDLIRIEARAVDGGERHVYLARKIVLATGIEGNGDWQLPSIDFSEIPAERYVHTNWEFDAAAFHGKRVAVLGAGASAFDTAATALETGAAQVHHFVRRKSIPSVNPFRLMEKSGFLNHFAAMSDAERWRWMAVINAYGQTPTQDGVNRCAAFPNYLISLGMNWRGVAMVGEEIEVAATDGSYHRFDLLVLGTGYLIDMKRRQELASFADRIALWQDRYTPPAREERSPVATYPYLSDDLSFQEREPGTAPFLKNIHNFTYMATASVGYSGASLTGMKYGIQRLLGGLVRFFWLAEAAGCLSEIVSYEDIDLDTAPLEPHVVATK